MTSSFNFPANSIADILQQRAIANPQALAYIFLEDGENKEQKLTYQELDAQAKAIGSQLQVTVQPGDRALLIYPYAAVLDFIAAFMGCLYAGVVAVPCHPPMNSLTSSEIGSRLIDAEAAIILSNTKLLSKLKTQLGKLPKFEQLNPNWLDTSKVNLDAQQNYHKPDLKSEKLAFLQYTSGSTGEPKGVMISHACLLQNQEMLKLAFGHNQNSVGVGWLPIFHDMGLIGNVIQPIYLGITCVLMSPISFVQKPLRWLQAISKYQATTSGAPNFAYELLCDRVKDSQLKQLDLSSWQIAFCGAEPVQAATLNRFAQKFAVCGFQPSAFYPCYGMAEATLMITGGDYQQPPLVKYLDKAALEKNQVIFRDRNSATTTALISAGHTWLDGKLEIVNPETQQQCQPNQIGEIWFSSPSVGLGYWHKPELTKATFQAKLKQQSDQPHFLRTGDLGFIAGQELFITGRLHDVLVLWGLNYYPQQIEQTVADCHPALKANHGTAFTIKVKDQNRLIIVQEIERTHRKSFVIEDVVEAIRWAIFQQQFLDVYAIVLLKPGSLPKTSSGKVQRSKCQAMYLAGDQEMLAQWSAGSEANDMTTLMARYTNPLTYMKILLAVLQGKLRRLLYLIWS